MDIMELGAIGELVGGVAVIATLVYLAIQVKQNSRYAHRAYYGSAARDCADWMMELAKDNELSRIYHQGLRVPETLAPEEVLRFNDALGSFLTLLESFYLHNQEFKEAESQARWAAVIRRLLRLPGGEAFWEHRKWMYNAVFMNYVDEQCLSVTQEIR